jgi:hypothetical protein
VGRFEFLVDSERGARVEIGTPVVATTTEGDVIGTVVDLRTVGEDNSPLGRDYAARYPSDSIAKSHSVIVGTVQVFWSRAMRPVRAGVVRAAADHEVALATGADGIEWPIAAGAVPLLDGQFARVCFDGHALLGPESAAINIAGLSGQAAKTSYAGVLLRSAIAAGGDDESVGALIFNVKGTDLLYLDQVPGAGYELDDEDRALYTAMGLDATPFEDVVVYAPSLPGGNGTLSAREDTMPLRWDLLTVWDQLHYFIDNMYDDEKLMSFLADFRDLMIRNPDPNQRIDTFAKLENWFTATINAAEAEDSDRGNWAWRTHHTATLRRVRRTLTNLPARCGGLLTKESAKPGEDVPVEGWAHGRVVVVDIAGLQTDIQAMVISRTIERLLRKSEDSSIGVDHLVLFLDELNAFAPASGGDGARVRKILQRVSTQGRYAGISLWGASQKLSKVDELVRDNAATRAVGVTAEGELQSGVYGKLAGGLTERLATLPKGQMALWHYSFRSALVVRFPRPAWRTGKDKSSKGRRKIVDSLGLGSRSVARLTEGTPTEVADAIIAGADDSRAAVEALAQVRVPDMRKTSLHEQSTVDPSDPFAIGD